MKTCSGCKVEFTLDNFHKDKQRPDGLRCYCKSCANQKKREQYKIHRANSLQYIKEYRVKNKEKLKEYSKKYCKENSEARKSYSKQWRKDNLERAREYDKQYALNNRAKLSAKESRRNAKKVKATPKWLTKEHLTEIDQMFQDCRDVEWLSDSKLEVDHIIPLRGKNVCGLHVPWNLQVLPKVYNTIKNNKFDGTYDNNSWRK